MLSLRFLFSMLLVSEAPELDAVFQLGSHESGVERENHLPCPGGQDVVVFSGLEVHIAGSCQSFHSPTLQGFLELLSVALPILSACLACILSPV